MKKKVAIASAINTNYGTLLQAYATQHELEKRGLETVILNYRSNPVRQWYRVFNFKFLITKLKALNVKLITRFRYKDIYEQILVREEAFDVFRKSKLKMTERFTDISEIVHYISEFNGVVLGSDQVWNPQNLEMDYYTLNFVPDNIPKITYSPSFGVSSIPKKQIQKTKAYLNKIDYISVRELAGVKIVKELIDRDVPVVCDPTALLTAKEWDEIKSNKKYVDGDYIFCYFLGDNPQYREFASKIAVSLGCSIVSIQHMDEFVKGDLKFGDCTPYDVDPADFINLISNATYVLTDSFHATMFSIYYKAPFFTFNFDDNKSKSSVNSRIDSIMKLLNIENRRLTGIENVNDCLERIIDWDDIYVKLGDLRKSSIEYLENALCNTGLI